LDGRDGALRRPRRVAAAQSDDVVQPVDSWPSSPPVPPALRGRGHRSAMALPVIAVRGCAPPWNARLLRLARYGPGLRLFETPRMRIALLTFGLLMTSLVHTMGQVFVEVLLDEPEFLRDESLIVKVRIANRSGQLLHLGQTADWLTFAVQSHDGHSVDKAGEVPVINPFTVESSQTATKTVNLMPHFQFPQPGRYSVTATVKVPGWSDEFLSLPKPFHIIRGARIWEQEFGVPKKEGVPEVRKYSLVRAQGLKHVRLYARVTDLDEHRVFRVVPLGQVVSFGKPETQVDKQSRLHVLFQNGPRSFLYAAFTPDGEWAVRQYHDYAETRPALRVSETGQVLVNGGFRRYTTADIPPTATAGADEPAKSPVPPPPAAPGKEDKPAKQ